jgi:hypothetical protein
VKGERKMKRVTSFIVGAGLAFLTVQSTRAQDALFPPPPTVSILSILPDGQWAAPGPPLNLDATAKMHVAQLKEDPFYGKTFEVSRIDGNPDAQEIIFLLPQYHRSPSFPVAWMSLGSAIADVQENIAMVIERLSRLHGLSCIGTEGNIEPHLPKSFELEQRAWWLHDLEVAQNDVHSALGVEVALVQDDMDVLTLVLHNAVKEQAALLDGVGTAQARIAADRTLFRFGLEDLALNRSAQQLARRLESVNRDLALLEPVSQSVVADALGEMWLAEIDLYEESTLRPMRDSLSALNDMQMLLRQDGDGILASSIGRYVALAKRIASVAIRADEIDAMTAHYRQVREVSEAVDGGQAHRVEEKRLSKTEARKKRRLEKRREQLGDEYEKITYFQREKRAVEKVFENWGKSGNKMCAIVMGAGHTDGLRQAVLDRFKKEKGAQALITITTLVTQAESSPEN